MALPHVEWNGMQGRMFFDGWRLVEDPNLTKAGEPRKVKRTMKERFLSRPWRPWITHKTMVPQVASDEFLINELTRTIIGHPSMLNTLTDTITFREQ